MLGASRGAACPPAPFLDGLTTLRATAVCTYLCIIVIVIVIVVSAPPVVM